MLFSLYCREFNSLQKRYTAHLHRTNTFFQKIKSYGRWSAEKLTVKFYLAPGVRNRKLYLAPGMRNEKIYLVPNDNYEKFYLAVKGLNWHRLHTLHHELARFHFLFAITPKLKLVCVLSNILLHLSGTVYHLTFTMHHL